MYFRKGNSSNSKKKHHAIHGLKFNANIDRNNKIVQHADECTLMAKEPNS